MMDHWRATMLPLSLLLPKCADFEATDPRDKVYAVLGLASDDSSLVICPEYENKTTREVYIDAARYVLNSKAPLALLPFAGIGDRTTKSTPFLPSWVPDWASPPRAAELDPPLHNHYNETRYYASLNTNPEITLDARTNTLTLGGAIVDQITAIGPLCHFEITPSKIAIENYGSEFHPYQVAKFVSWHEKSFAIALSGTKLDHRASIEEAFWRTLIGDTTSTTRPAPATLADDYRKWINSSRLVHQYHLQKGKGVTLPPGLSPASPEFAIWGTAMGLCAKWRRVCVTRRGYLGMVPAGTREGDLVAIVSGTKTPFVLRRDGKAKGTEAFELVGECYVDGMMDGEMMRMLPRMEKLSIV
jgi:hypothetical protein